MTGWGNVRSLLHRTGRAVIHEEWAGLIEEISNLPESERQLAIRYIAEDMRKRPQRWPAHACGPRQHELRSLAYFKDMAPLIHSIHTGHITLESHDRLIEQLHIPELKIQHLSIDLYSLDAQAVRAIFAAPSTRNLRTLHLKGISFYQRAPSDEVHPLRGLFDLPAGPSIEELVIHNIEGHDSAILSTVLEQLPSLHTLGIHGGMYQPERWHHLLQPLQHARKLRHVDLSRTHHSGEAVAQMATLGILDALESLSTGYNIHERSLLHLCESLNENLHSLKITGHAFQRESLKAFGHALFLPRLERLSVSNPAGVPTVELMESFDELELHRTLKCLELKHMELGPMAMQKLWTTHEWPLLEHLAIPYNVIQHEGLEHLLASTTPMLRSLDLTWNKLPVEALREFARRANVRWSWLRSVALAQNLDPLTEENRRSIEQSFSRPMMISWRK